MNFSNLENFLSMFTDGKGQIDGKQIKKAYIGRGGVAKEFKKGYIEENGLARLFFKGGVDVSTMYITYSGNHTDQVVTMGDGKQYRLLTLTSSGTLTLEDEVTADVWMCGGGDSVRSNGGDGAYFNQLDGIVVSNAVVVIGSGATAATSSTTTTGNGGISTFAGVSSKSKKGATGGKVGESNKAGENGKNASENTKPFKDSHFTKYPCAGGAGGGFYRPTDNRDYYGDGGGGGNGDPSASITVCKGGATGGGASGGSIGTSTTSTGGNASYYGSGGGGGQYRMKSAVSITYYTSGSGYQGICYVRIPLEQSA